MVVIVTVTVLVTVRSARRRVGVTQREVQQEPQRLQHQAGRHEGERQPTELRRGSCPHSGARA
jgi:hypothetical protein